MISKLMEVTASQDKVIKLQQNAINEMFIMLCQYMTMEELEPTLDTLERIAEDDTTGTERS